VYPYGYVYYSKFNGAVTAYYASILTSSLHRVSPWIVLSYAPAVVSPEVAEPGPDVKGSH